MSISAIFGGQNILTHKKHKKLEKNRIADVIAHSQAIKTGAKK